MKHPEPWYRESKDAWFICLGGKQKRLAKGKENKAAAYEAYHKLMAEDGRTPPSKDLTIAEIVARFRVWSEAEHAETTRDFYESHLKPFLAFKNIARKKASELTPSDVSAWLSSRKVHPPKRKKEPRIPIPPKPISPSTKRGAITVIKALYTFAEKNCRIKNDVIRHMERPPMGRRQAATAEQRAAIMAEVKDEEFRDFLTAVMESGARPGEIARMTGEMVDLGEGIVTFHGKTTGETGKDRVIFLTETLKALLGKLIERQGRGVLFLNTDGKPWDRNSIRCRFRRLRAKLGLKGVVCYSLRHAFVTDGLEAGVPIAQMAEMAGHSDTKMISSVYSHLRERRQHMRDQMEKAAKKRGE